MNFKLLLFLIISASFSTSLHSQSTVKITSTKQIYRSGEPIIVDFSTTSPLAEQSWVGLFKASIPRNRTTGYLQYIYTNSKTKGKFTFIHLNLLVTMNYVCLTMILKAN